jgi:hypothetical protein
MDKAYVILRTGYEYNDEIYYESEAGGGMPNLIVFSEKDAKDKVNELNIIEYKSQSLTNYCYDIEEVLNVEESKFKEFNDSLVEKYGKIVSKNRWDDTDNILHPMANQEESLEYAKLIKLSFYEIIETPIDKQGFREEKINQVLDGSL